MEWESHDFARLSIHLVKVILSTLLFFSEDVQSFCKRRKKWNEGEFKRWIIGIISIISEATYNTLQLNHTCSYSVNNSSVQDASLLIVYRHNKVFWDLSSRIDPTVIMAISGYPAEMDINAEIFKCYLQLSSVWYPCTPWVSRAQSVPIDHLMHNGNEWSQTSISIELIVDQDHVAHCLLPIRRLQKNMKPLKDEIMMKDQQDDLRSTYCQSYR